MDGGRNIQQASGSCQNDMHIVLSGITVVNTSYQRKTNNKRCLILIFSRLFFAFFETTKKGDKGQGFSFSFMVKRCTLFDAIADQSS